MDPEIRNAVAFTVTPQNETFQCRPNESCYAHDSRAQGYVVLMEEIKEKSKQWKAIPCSWTERLKEGGHFSN